MNVADSSWIAQALIERGWRETGEQDADVYIINTCSVREKPELKVASTLGRLAGYIEEYPERFAVVGGCVAQQKGKDFMARFPFVRLVFGSDGVPPVPNTIELLAHEPGMKVDLLRFLPHYPERDNVWQRCELITQTPRQAFVNIMQGCDNFCSYCIVPFVRGREKSRMPHAIVDECRAHAERGVREITLLGQNVNSYGQKGESTGLDFSGLLREVAEIDGIRRIRFTTSHPKDISDGLIRCFAEVEKLCPQLHLPVQSGSDQMLKAMNRRYTSGGYLDIIGKLRRARPDIYLTTDIIVGFPGETEADFRATMNLMEMVRYDSAFSFKYSDRPGTKAAEMTPKVDDKTGLERLARFQERQNRITEEKLAEQVSNRTEILVEGPSRVQSADGNWWKGRDPQSRIVNVALPKGTDATGLFVPVRIVTAKKHSLVGERTGEPW